MGEDVAGPLELPLPDSLPNNNVVSPISGPRHVHFSVLDTRLLSFHDWPPSMPQKPRQLAEAGFFYLGRGDKVQCYSCDGGVHNWMPDDEPWEEHAKWMPNCSFLNLVKGPDYVRSVQRRLHNQQNSSESEASTSCPEDTTNENASNIDSAEEVGAEDLSEIDVRALISENRRLKEARLCKICLHNELGVVFVPCGHMATCVQCASAFHKCPVCRQLVDKAVRTFLS